MKLLLTSAGITNDSIAQSLMTLAGKPANELKVAFIPTAANVEEGNKVAWFFRQYEDLRRIGIEWVDMVDFAAADVDWESRLDACDVLYLTGGNTFYLLDQIHKQGFDEYLTKALSEKVYVGGSASTITMTPSIEVADMPPGDPNLPWLSDLTGLGYVDFEVEPHCDEALFGTVQVYAREHAKKLYAIDDQTAIQVEGGEVTVISEGQWKLFELTGD
ncbi:MAG TPA: Type 1 glutamine amidotransferase-like domain-containing protein [Candidatus Saccharimonadales bacterium]|nr:Type 1 glutamine amidotransferase-like domain-containing protein [Candidatus Saccharimonadales bacterium]